MQNRRTPWLAVLSLFALATSAGACGGGSGGGDGGIGGTPGQSSGVSGSKTLATITDAEMKMFCDWSAGLYGGYGKETICPDDGSGLVLTITGPASQAECLAQAAKVPSTCRATVAQAETCTRAISTCDESDDAAAASACTALMSCAPTSP